MATDSPTTAPEEAAAQVEALLAQARQFQERGDLNQVRVLYAQALRLSPISRETQRQILAAIELLETAQALDGGEVERPAGAEQALGELLQDLLARIRSQMPNLYTLLRLSAVPLWLDEGILAVLRGRQDGSERSVLERLSRYSFFYEWTDRFSMSREARRLLLAEWQPKSEEFLSLNRQLLAHFEGRLAAEPPRDPVALERLIQSQLYHAMLVDPEQGVHLLGHLFQQAQDEYRLSAARQYLMVCKEIRPLLAASTQGYVDYFEAWYHHLKGNRHAAVLLFQQLSQRGDLAPDLRARVLRGLAAALVTERRWVQALAHYQTALALFRSLGDRREMAYTMNGLGDAYLDLAIITRGQGDHFDPFVASSAGLSRLFGLFSLLARLPLVLYLILTLRLFLGSLSLDRLGRGMDWVIARLFSQAILCFRQARQILTEQAYPLGISRVDENLARLYLEINHPHQAKAEYQALLDGSLPLGSYRQARIRLELAEADLRLGQWAEARRLLDGALPVFTALGHHRRVAETQTRLGHLAVVERGDGVGLTAYGRALDAWQQSGNPEAATNVFHHLEALARRLGEPDGTAAVQARAKTPVRTYSIGYAHPVMQIFKRVAVIGLILTTVFVVMVGLRTESGAQIGADMALNLPLQQEKEGGFGPEVEYTLQQQIVPQADSNLTRGAPLLLAQSALAYLLIYTLLGFYVIKTISLAAVQAHQRLRITVDDQGISQISDDGETVTVPWRAATALLRADRRLRRTLLRSFSATAVLGPGQEVEAPGSVSHYPELTTQILARLDAAQPAARTDRPARFPWPRRQPVGGVPILDTGFTVLGNWAGWLFLLSFLGLLGFVAVVVLDPARLIAPLFPGQPYALVDFYSLLYLGIGLPLLYWFVLLIARWHLILRPYGPALAWLGALALGTTLLSSSQVIFFQLPLGRPDVLWSGAALLVILFTLKTVWIARSRRQEEGESLVAAPRAFGWTTRLLVTTLGVILAGVVLFFLGLEVLSYNSLVQANHLLAQAETLRIQEPAAAGRLYAQATDAYDTSLGVRATPNLFNSLGSIYVQLGKLRAAGVEIDQEIYICGAQAAAEMCTPQENLGRDELFQAAVNAYEVAWAQQPGELTYRLNMALAYQEWASALDRFGDLNGRYRQALEIYDQVAAQVEKDPGRYGGLAQRVREYRAAANYNLAAKIYSQLSGKADAFPFYTAAAADYRWLIENTPSPRKRAVALTGLGWTEFNLRYKLPQTDLDGRDLYLQRAIDHYQAGIVQDPSYGPLYNGLGWTEYYLVFSRPTRCNNSLPGEPDRAAYIRGIERSIDVFRRGVQADTANGTYYRTLAQLDYILAFCNPEYARIPQLLRSLEDYDAALARSPQAVWFYRQGTINLVLGDTYRAAGEPEQAQRRYELAREALGRAIAANPLEVEHWHWLNALYGANYLNLDRAGLVDEILAAADLAPTYANLLNLGRKAIGRAGRQYLGRRFLDRAVAVNPAGSEALRLLGQDRFAQADYPAALDFAQRALDADPTDTAARLLLGRAYLRLDRFDESVAVLQTVAVLIPADFDAQLSLGWAAYRAGQDGVAVGALERASRLRPQDPQPRFYQGLAYVAQGERQAALRAYAQAISAANALEDPRQRRTRYDEAIADLLGVRADPARAAEEMVERLIAGLAEPVAEAGGDLAAFYLQEGSAALAVGRLGLALRLLEHARSVDATNGQILLRLAQVYLAQEDTPTALTLLNQAVQLLPNDPEVRRLYGWTAFRLGQPTLALAQMELAMNLAAENAQIRFNLAVILAAVGRGEQAAQILAEGIDQANRAPDRASLDALYGELVRELRALPPSSSAPAAEELLDQAAEGYTFAQIFDRTAYRTYWLTGWDLYEKGLYELSAAMSAWAVVLNPQEPRVRFNQALAQLAAGQGQRAVLTYAEGIAAAAGFGEGVARLQEALGDLRANRRDPTGLAPEIMRRLEEALAGQ